MRHPLTQYRRDAGLTLQELGDRLNVGRAAVCKWERRQIPAERVLEIERVTGVPRHELRPDLYPPPAEGRAA
jgi:DNA-binding transcriptional regulator YdaS (Cro superfamily)